MRLTGKRGRLRGTCNGKRVDFSSRSVITPEVALDVDELGVPRAVAMTQTIPERVTRFNLEELGRAVRNGPARIPGAQAYVHDGVRTNLSMCRDRARVQLVLGDVVHRNLRNGDWVVFNRQPTLHKASIMGHRVRVMDGRSFRLSLPCTIPYNADFDGDEMNMHVPQGVEARAEVEDIMSVTMQLLSAQKCAPSMGLVQDSLISAFLLTSRDTFLSRGAFFDCMMRVHYGDDTHGGAGGAAPPHPAVFCRDPRTGVVTALYTGKQLLGTVLPRGLTMSRKTRNLGDCDPMDARERWVSVRAGELVCGQVGKEILGAKSGSAVHIVSLDLSRERALQFLSDCQRVLCAWLTRVGFSVGVKDCLLSRAADQKISDMLAAVYDHVDAQLVAGGGAVRKGAVHANAKGAPRGGPRRRVGNACAAQQLRRHGRVRRQGLEHEHRANRRVHRANGGERPARAAHGRRAAVAAVLPARHARPRGARVLRQLVFARAEPRRVVHARDGRPGRPRGHGGQDGNDRPVGFSQTNIA
jgi:DNA-directed RNA polymerase II subunit RPB1